jgi:hypothetical protein
MAVWVRQEGKAAVADEVGWKGLLYRPLDPSKLSDSTALSFDELIEKSASHCWGSDSLDALNDRVEPHDSCDHNIPRFTWWDHRGTTEWAQYDFPASRKVSAVQVYWFDDSRKKGSCRVPQSWRLLYKDGNAWKPVAGQNSYGVELDKYNRAAFNPVETTGLRIEVQLKPGVSGGILEWKWE